MASINYRVNIIYYGEIFNNAINLKKQLEECIVHLLHFVEEKQSNLFADFVTLNSFPVLLKWHTWF